MTELGRQRYTAKVANAKKYNHQSGTVAGRYLLREAVADFEAGLRKFLKVNLGKAGPYHDVLPLLDTFSPEVVALISVRGILDGIGRNITLLKAGFMIGNALEEEARYISIRESDPVLWKDLRKRMKRTRSEAGKKAVITSVMRKIHSEFQPWAKREKLRLGIMLVELIRQHTGLIEVQKLSLANGRALAVVVPTDGTLDWLEKSNEAHEVLYPFWLPSVVPPLRWDDPWNGGYHTNLVTRNPIVKTSDQELLAELEQSDLSEVYNAVNILQETKWEINPEVYETMRHFWEAGHPIADLPERVDEAKPERPDNVDTDEEALKQYKKALSIRRQRIVASRSRRVLASKIMFMAEHFRDLAFYFPYQADFRGRVYTVPYFLQPQGPSQARGLLRFAEGRAITTEAQAHWLAVHGANCYGVDKVSFPERVRWVEEHEAEIRAVYQDPLENRWWATADKPWEFLAFCLEWADYLDAGFGFVSKLPVSMDGSNNGLQIFSLLLRDRVGAEATNCVPSEVPRDIYQDVADAVTEKLRKSDDPMAAQWLEFVDGRLPRDATKRSVMTLPYGSTFHACIHYTRDWYEETRKKKGTTPFERGYHSSVFLAKLIWEAIGERVSSARAAMEWMREVARIFAKHGLPVRWTSPTGFPVKQSYWKYETKRIKTSVGDTIRWTKYREDTTEIARQKQMNGVSPNFIHSLDAAALAKSVILAHDAGIDSFMMIHDSYGVLAADAPRMAGVLREVYAEMFSDDLLKRLKDELELYLPQGVTLPPLPESGDLDVNEVKNSLYFFA